MRTTLTLSFSVLTLTSFAQVPYVSAPTNAPVDGYVVSRSGDRNKWIAPAAASTNASAVAGGTNVFLQTNGMTVTINSTTDTNIVNILSSSNSLFNGLWRTNAADGSITNLNGGGVGVRTNGVNLTLGISHTQLFQNEEAFLGNGDVTIAGIIGGDFTGSTNSFAFAGPGSWAGGSFNSSSNCYAQCDYAGSFAGADFFFATNSLVRANPGFVNIEAEGGSNNMAVAEVGIITAYLDGQNHLVHVANGSQAGVRIDSSKNVSIDADLGSLSFGHLTASDGSQIKSTHGSIASGYYSSLTNGLTRADNGSIAIGQNIFTDGLNSGLFGRGKTNHNQDFYAFTWDGVIGLGITTNILTIRNVQYKMPTAAGVGGQILSTDGGSPQQVFWTDVPTNTPFVTTIVSIASNSTSVVLSNQLNARISGHTNQVAMFTPNTNTVGDSIMNQVSTNEIQIRSRLSGTAWTNDITNSIYGRDSGAGSWDRLVLVSTSGLGNGYNELNAETTLSAPNGLPDLKLYNAYTINHGTKSATGHPAGSFQPLQDNVFDFGGSSSRMKHFYAGPGGFIASDTAGIDVTGNLILGTYAINGFSGAMEFYKVGVASAMFIKVSSTEGLTGPVIGSNAMLGFGAATDGSIDTILRRGNEKGTFSFSTNNTSTTSLTELITGGEGSGTDKAGDNIRIGGGRGTGNGRPGDILFATAITNGGSGSGIQTLTDRMKLSATNGLLTVYSNINYTTNQGTMQPDFARAFTTIITNAAFTVLPPVNVDPNRFEQTMMRITNSTAAAVLITPPANVNAFGTWYVTNITYLSFSHAGMWETNCIASPIR